MDPKKPLFTVTNGDTQMEAKVWPSTYAAAGFNVTVRDLDSGEYLTTAYCSIQTFDAACEKARELVK
jgi:hypothetical protein